MEDYRLKQLIEEQQKYDKAKVSKTHSQDDLEIARKLQRQFNEEIASENPSNLIYETKKKNIDNTKSLVDPSWEVIDPTPDIHNLFMAFNQQFFWNKLLSVCVSWSKRMTTCAGICSYQPTGGMCSITLSEPLLKLRPRKDLVETLLHEMIHAFLFVTHNNRDRDGHGPEFHKHMYRINDEAGTNITVYHTFHDEVRLYQQHWWKCNGPCQNLKPFYGMVRRATNRAPGPNDRWWGQHMQSCGGTFVKVKEPEKASKGKGKGDKENTKPTAKATSSKAGQVKVKSPPKHADIRNFFPVKQNTPIKSPSVGFPSNSHKKHDNTNIQNINGFKPGQNGSLELKNTPATVSKPVLSLFNGLGHVLSAFSSATNDYTQVRNHWLDKFDNKPGPSQPPPKRQKITTKKCPSCQEEVPESEFNYHNNICLNSVKTNLIECDICDEWITANELESHKEGCIQSISTQLDSTISKECPICQEPLCASLYDCHVAECVMKRADNVLNQAAAVDETVNCLVCKRPINKSRLNEHLNECMSETIFMTDDEAEQFFDDSSFEESFVQQDKTANGGINDADTILIEDDDGGVGSANEEFANCPVCQERVKTALINEHLDRCLS